MFVLLFGCYFLIRGVAVECILRVVFLSNFDRVPSDRAKIVRPQVETGRVRAFLDTLPDPGMTPGVPSGELLNFSLRFGIVNRSPIFAC